ncbi:MAG: DUF3857 domain-containing transglutaminase family protein [Acidobacteriota bacterium]
MIADPAAPGAPAVYLFLEQTADDDRQMHTYYARIKILTEAGREKFADIVIPYRDKEEKIRGIEARTIHSDGTVIPFAGKPWQKEVARAGGVRMMEKGFSMPDVQVGSIVEYRYETTYSDWWAPHWYVQHSAFVHQEHYHFKPGPGGHVEGIRLLPATAQVTEKGGQWDLVMNNVPAFEDEDDSPPMDSFAERMLFYYVRNIDSPDHYWQVEGDGWSGSVDRFVVPEKLKDAVAQIVAPGDTDDQKLRKIYAAVMKLDNTSFSRTLSRQEDKRLKLKFRNAADIWKQQRGDDDDIALLLIGLARAAGLKAWAMMVSDRDHNIFIREELDWSQLDDIVAIVSLGGKDIYLDPGERYCQYGKLNWIHTGTMGVRQTDKGSEIAKTPPPVYTDNMISRSADLHLAGDGSITGVIREVMDGAPALRWRQEALVTDDRAAQTDFEKELQKSLPDGVEARVNHFVGLTDGGQLMAVVDVTGHLGTRTGKRLILPGEFFEARATPRFGPERRENPVDLRYPLIAEDDVRIDLAPGLSPETIPSEADLPLPHRAEYRSRYQSAKNMFEVQRTLGIGSIFYKKDDYPQLRDFFQKVGAQDQTQVVLMVAPGMASAASAPAGQ